jgi:hypothetical protein
MTDPSMRINFLKNPNHPMRSSHNFSIFNLPLSNLPCKPFSIFIPDFPKLCKAMSMKRISSGIVLFFILQLSVYSPVSAQYYFYDGKYYESDLVFEAGGSVGLMNSLTDLGGKKGIGKGFIKDLNGKNYKPSFSVFGTFTYKYIIGLRLEATFGKLQAYDSILKPVAASTFGRYERNLSFRSPVIDIQATLEFHPLFLKVDLEKDPPVLSPYILGGIGYFNFNPQAKLDGNWVNLQPLRTEGQGFSEYPARKPYKLSQINIPFGAGLKYEINSFLNVRFEIVHRILSTDYLDDVSTAYINPGLFANYLSPAQAAIAARLQDRGAELNPGHITIPDYERGDPSDNDAFFSIQAKISLVFGRMRRTNF